MGPPVGFFSSSFISIRRDAEALRAKQKVCAPADRLDGRDAHALCRKKRKKGLLPGAVAGPDTAAGNEARSSGLVGVTIVFHACDCRAPKGSNMVCGSVHWWRAFYVQFSSIKEVPLM